MSFNKNFFANIFRMLVLIISFTRCTDHAVDPDDINTMASEEIKRIAFLKVPAQIQLPDQPKGHSIVTIYFASGVQKYKAQIKAGSNPETYEWAFVAPEAKLYDISNAKIGTHYAGPSWKLDGTNDLITGQAFNPAKASNVDPNSIDWLLLMTKSGTTATGIFKDVDYIHRLATKGGRVPVSLPSSPTQTIDVPYTAVYVFLKIND